MSFKQAFESKLNKELAEDHNYPPPPPIDIENQQDPPPVHIFQSYPPETARRSGMYVPTLVFALFVLAFLFESGIIFVYTIVALWNTLPGSLGPMQPPPCNCPSLPAMIVAPNGWPQLPDAATTITHTTDSEVTITVTPSVAPSKSSSTETSKSTSSDSSISAAPAATTSALEVLLSALGLKPSNTGLVTVTAPVPTRTVLTTASPELPSITTMTVLSTAAPPPQSTITSTALITAG